MGFEPESRQFVAGEVSSGAESCLAVSGEGFSDEVGRCDEHADEHEDEALLLEQVRHGAVRR